MSMTGAEVMTNLMHYHHHIPNYGIVHAPVTSAERRRKTKPICRIAQDSKVGHATSKTLAEKCVMNIMTADSWKHGIVVES